MNTANQLQLYITLPRAHVSHFKVFGHFFQDHLFQLYKMKRWLETSQNLIFSGVSIRGNRELRRKASFTQDFYKAIFGSVHDAWLPFPNRLNVGVVMGSQMGSETDPVYLDRSSFRCKFPEEVVANGRKLTPLNMTYGLELREILLSHFQASGVSLHRRRALILDRKMAARRLLNLQVLITLLRNNGYDSDVVYPEDLSIADQVRLTHSYPLVVAACGSAQVHVSFMRKNSVFIELCESGFRYPNTAIYGNRYGVNTYTICRTLDSGLDKFRFRNKSTEELFVMGDSMPNVIKNTAEDVEREKKWYSMLLSPECIDCYRIHTTQDIDCQSYMQDIEAILQASNETLQIVS